MASVLDDNNLELLLRGGESDRVEFKESLGGDAPDAIRRAVCAFANDLPGRGLPGVVFVGVRYNGTFIGIPPTDEQLRQLADMKTDGNVVPPPVMFVEERTLLGERIAVVTVFPSDSPPVRYRGRIHVRTGPRRDIANAQDERILNERRRYGNSPFDLQPIPPAALSDLIVTQFENEYLPQAFAADVLETNNRSKEERLAAVKMIASADDLTPTVLGILVLGKSPQDFLPGAYVQFLRLDGKDLASPIMDSEDFRGSISDVLRRLDEKMSAHNHTSVDLTSADTEQRRSLYPMAALQQITRNAVMHRTYENTNAPVRVSWFSDRVEVLSPGGPFGSVNTANFGNPGITDYRNPNLAEAMRTLGFVQRFGVGISTARRLLREAGHPAPVFSPIENHVLVEVWGTLDSGGVYP